MLYLLDRINHIVWGVPALFLILGVGVYFTIRTGCLQIRMLPMAFKQFLDQFRLRNHANGQISSYKAVCTALAATVGTGNLAGVAGGIALGGPGAVFWMWVCAILGMILKFAEVSLAVHYRHKNSRGEWEGGPMYMIRCGLSQRWKWLAGLYCFFGVVAAFGVGNTTQINTVIYSINGVLRTYHGGVSTMRNVMIGSFLAVILTTLLLGGAKRIGQVAECLVPFASVLYLLLGIGVLIVCHDALPVAFHNIITGAFRPQAVTGGVVGSAMICLRTGAARGVFTNEAGMGTASIAHAGANVTHPFEQGLMGIVEVFLDTIVICTMTALVILCSGVNIPYGMDVGVQLTMDAFSKIYGDWVGVFIAVALCVFACATILGWGLYGGRCAQYLFGEKSWKSFAIMQGIFIIVGATMNMDVVWKLSEVLNGCMAIPNLIALGMLSPVLFRLVDQYKKSGTRL